MARSLSNILGKKIAAFPAANLTASGSFYRGILRFSTTVPDDPDTHEDFRPSNKVQESTSLNEIVEKDVKENPVMIYMKGVPEHPQCGFSALAVRMFLLWPTFPQIFIKGEFVGGSDIILSMHQTGELKEKLKDVGKQQESDSE